MELWSADQKIICQQKIAKDWHQWDRNVWQKVTLLFSRAVCSVVNLGLGNLNVPIFKVLFLFLLVLLKS